MCNKVKLANPLEAKIALASTQRKTGSHREERRYYRCKECSKWHLTKKPYIR